MCSNINWDDWLAYPTVKVVTVRDRYIGGLRLLFLLLIFGYVVGYVLIYNKAYNQLETPVGAIQLSLLKPPRPFETNTYMYCSQYNGTKPRPKGYGEPIVPCQVMDENDAYQPVDETNAMFITTRFSEYEQVRVCGTAYDPSPCTFPWKTNTSSFWNNGYRFIADVESFTIRFRHFFLAQQFYLSTKNAYYAQPNSKMSGKLLDLNGGVIETFGASSGDIIPLSLLLTAAGVVLDAPSGYPSNATESVRYAGAVLMLTIDYTNVNTQSNVEYTYRVIRIPEEEYKVMNMQYLTPMSRLVQNRHGIKIFYIFTGTIAKANFQTALVQLVSALGLLSVATLVTDSFMIYVSKLKPAYKQYKFEVTADHEHLMKMTAGDIRSGGSVRLKTETDPLSHQDQQTNYVTVKDSV